MLSAAGSAPVSGIRSRSDDIVLETLTGPMRGAEVFAPKLRRKFGDPAANSILRDNLIYAFRRGDHVA